MLPENTEKLSPVRMNCPCWRYSYKSKSARTEGQHLGASCDRAASVRCIAMRTETVSCHMSQETAGLLRLKASLSLFFGGALPFLLEVWSRGHGTLTGQVHKHGMEGPPVPRTYLYRSLSFAKVKGGLPASSLSFFLQGYDGFVSLFLSAGLWAREFPPFRLSLFLSAGLFVSLSLSPGHGGRSMPLGLKPTGCFEASFFRQG